MEIAELKAFIAVQKTGSFSAAAKTIHLSQPAISKRIAQLEASLGQNLFDRIGHKVYLTEAGLRLLPHASNILDTIQDSLHEIGQLQEQPSGILKIATSYHVGLHHLPDRLKTYYNDYAEVELDLRFMDSEDALAAVVKGEIEMAIITLPSILPGQLMATPLWKDPMQIVCAKDHPLIKSTDMHDLESYPAILPDNNTMTRQLVETELSKHKLDISVRLSSNHLESIRMMVEIGLGWSVLPQTLESEALHICKFKQIMFSRDLGVVTHQQRTLTKAATLLIERLQ
jgi:DNA-binding transcriptional LysR family regulator